MHARIVLILLSFFLSQNLYSQRIFIGKEETSRPLTWSDFQGDPQFFSVHHAVTTWQMSYSMDGVRIVGDSIHIDKMEVKLEMDPKRSWVKKDKANAWLLKHEQGHFNIGLLCVREFMYVFNNTTFRKHNFDAKMKQIFNDAMTKYHNMGLQYDEETNHSMNTEAQKKWDAYFAENL